jgi:ribosomal protein S18 acetylase RimI-like enzyme
MSELAVRATSARTVQLDIPADLKRAFKVMKELRSTLELGDFTRLMKLAQAADGYRLVGREVGGRLVAVMGFRILHDLAHGSHLYIDDLVTIDGARSQGHGAELLHFAETETRRLGLSGLRLSARNSNEAGKRFYLREGWEALSVVFKKRVANH